MQKDSERAKWVAEVREWAPEEQAELMIEIFTHLAFNDFEHLKELMVKEILPRFVAGMRFNSPEQERK